MPEFIEPRILKGFRDFLPRTEMIRRDLTSAIESVFKSFGFSPIDTPALEYADILLGKGGGETEKQIYRFTDNGGRDVALRFDLTVPFARFTAQHREELAFPFKRYHIAKVWRGENTQRGRYREFTQCDFDIIGSESAAADFEILLLIRAVFQKLGIGVTVHVNHRGLFNRFLSQIGQRENSAELLRTVDKLAKVGTDSTRESLAALTGEANAEKILGFIGAKGGLEETLGKLVELSGGPSPESERLQTIMRFMLDSAEGGGGEPFVIDPSITRGLDYYTGVVFETFLEELPGIGSVCSGGRYDNLAGLYSKSKEPVSGVGSSIGLDRLLAAMESLGKLPDAESRSAAIAHVNEEEAGLYQALARRLREAGVSCEVFTEGDGNSLSKQFILAAKKGFKWIIIPMEKPLNGRVTLRDLAARQNKDVSVEEAANIIKA
ncbi:MAG: histidine--tRNA ligase [Treponema sp.]|jgi:histidyl-tRNA synthetase|nr:histidine--tRNA ligase [Treponema sp.]